MADPAREEVDRYLNPKADNSSLSHPEDRHLSDSDSEPDEKSTTEPAFQSSVNDDTDEEDLSNNMATLTTSRPNYHIPTTISYANTGPKGVIADAQNFERAKKSTFRQTLSNFTNNLSPRNHSRKEKSSTTKKGSQSDEESSTDDEFNAAAAATTTTSSSFGHNHDDAFMNQWRETRLRELQSQSQAQAQAQAQRRISPSRRTYGTVTHVDANGYLDAVEDSPVSTTVVVLLFDPTRQNLRSHAAERQCEILAYRYRHVRFVKLDYTIAEMEYLDCPAIIGYRAGEVVGSTSGWSISEDDNNSELLEKELIAQGILNVNL